MSGKEKHKNAMAFSNLILFCFEFKINSQLRLLGASFKNAVVLDLNQQLSLPLLWPDMMIS